MNFVNSQTQIKPDSQVDCKYTYRPFSSWTQTSQSPQLGPRPPSPPKKSQGLRKLSVAKPLWGGFEPCSKMCTLFWYRSGLKGSRSIYAPLLMNVSFLRTQKSTFGFRRRKFSVLVQIAWFWSGFLSKLFQITIFRLSFFAWATWRPHRPSCIFMKDHPE